MIYPALSVVIPMGAAHWLTNCTMLRAARSSGGVQTRGLQPVPGDDGQHPPQRHLQRLCLPAAAQPRGKIPPFNHPCVSKPSQCSCALHSISLSRVSQLSILSHASSCIVGSAAATGTGAACRAASRGAAHKRSAEWVKWRKQRLQCACSTERQCKRQPANKTAVAGKREEKEEGRKALSCAHGQLQDVVSGFDDDCFWSNVLLSAGARQHPVWTVWEGANPSAFRNFC